jgi:hypothetical protein
MLGMPSTKREGQTMLNMCMEQCEGVYLMDEIARLRNNQSILITSFRINMMRLCPEYSHEEFDRDIAAMLKEKE